MSTQPNTQVNTEVNTQASAYRAPMMPRLKSGLLALVLTGSLISPAHATGVPTVDGSAILTNLQQWYQNAQRTYSQMASMKPGELAASLVGSGQATSKAQEYISSLETVKTTMDKTTQCNKYMVPASVKACLDELQAQKAYIDAYIAMLKAVQEDYDALYQKVAERNRVATQFALGDLLTGNGMNTHQGELDTLDVQINDLRQRLGTSMQQNRAQIDMAKEQVEVANKVRVIAARGQFEGNTDGLSSLITKGAVVTTLSTAAAKYDAKTQEIKNKQITTTGRTGTNY